MSQTPGGERLPSDLTAPRPGDPGAARSGFTLVELLVVVVIIVILAALLVPVVFIALARARDARIAVEASNLAQAVERYKIEYGDYPPDLFSGPLAAINAHLTRVFRYRNVATDVPTGVANLDPSEALVFWLRGFSDDPTLPLTGSGARNATFDFDQSRLTDRDGDGHQEYIPRDGQNAPYVYFRTPYAGKTWTHASVSGTAKPYPADTPVGSYAQPNSFQIISAGQDGHFGSGGSFPSGTGYATQDRDNITNFSEGTLESAMP